MIEGNQTADAPSTDLLSFETMIWTTIAAGIQWMMFEWIGQLLSPYIPEVSFGTWPLWMQALGLLGFGMPILLIGLLNVALIFWLGEWIAAERRGLDLKEYKAQWAAARRADDRDRARREVRNGLGHLRDADGTEFFDVEIEEGDTKTEVRITEL